MDAPRAKQPSDLECALRALSEREVDCHAARAELAAALGQGLWGPLAHLATTAGRLLALELDPDTRREAELVAAAVESVHEVLGARLTLEPRPETAGLQRAVFDVQEALAPVLKSFAARAAAHEVEFACRISADVPPVLIGEPETLRAVARLLLDEALRGAGESGIAFELHLAPPSDGDVALEMAVHGMQDDTAHAPGLAACARLARLLDGRLWLELPHGGCGSVRLRLRCERVPERRRQSRGAPGPATVTVVAPPGIARDALVAQLAEQGTRAEVSETLWDVRAPQPGEAPRVALVAEGAWDAGWILAVDGSLERLALGSIFLISAVPTRVAVEAERRVGVRGVLREPVLPRECQEVLARAARGPQRIVERRGTPAPVERLSVLLAERERARRSLVRGELQRLGHDVVAVEDGPSLMARLEERPFDVLLVDLELPGIDGVSAARLVRARERQSGRRTPIVGLTPDAVRARDRELDEAGFDATLTYPFDGDRLSWTLARLCGARGFETGAA